MQHWRVSAGIAGLVGDHVGQLIDDQQHERLTRCRGPFPGALLSQRCGALAGQSGDVFQQLDGLHAVAAHQLLKHPRCPSEFHAALGVDPEHLHQTATDPRGQGTQHRPHHRGLPGVTDPRDEDVSVQ
jgi:hypothetical protein